MRRPLGHECVHQRLQHSPVGRRCVGVGNRRAGDSTAMTVDLFIEAIHHARCASEDVRCRRRPYARCIVRVSGIASRCEVGSRRGVIVGSESDAVDELLMRDAEGDVRDHRSLLRRNHNGGPLPKVERSYCGARRTPFCPARNCRWSLPRAWFDDRCCPDNHQWRSP
jgi:hypothetical protein